MKTTTTMESRTRMTTTPLIRKSHSTQMGIESQTVSTPMTITTELTTPKIRFQMIRTSGRTSMETELEITRTMTMTVMQDRTHSTFSRTIPTSGLMQMVMGGGTT